MFDAQSKGWLPGEQVILLEFGTEFRIPRSLIGRGEVDVTMIIGAKTSNTIKIALVA